MTDPVGPNTGIVDPLNTAFNFKKKTVGIRPLRYGYGAQFSLIIACATDYTFPVQIELEGPPIEHELMQFLLAYTLHKVSHMYVPWYCDRQTLASVC